MLNRAQEWRARSYEGIAFYQLGLVAAQQEDFDQALEYFSQALVISRETMNPYREAYIEQALGMLCALQHDYDGALNHYASARSLYDALDYGSHTREMTQRLVLTHLNRLLDRLLRFLGLRK
jgi:tetratricopeptide (TPR) repeat protein